MKTVKRFMPTVLLVIFDCISVAASFIIAIKLRYQPNPDNIFQLPTNFATYLNQYLISFILIFVAANFILGCYSSVYRHIGISDATRLLISVLISGSFFLLVEVIITKLAGYQQPRFTPIIIMLFFLFFMSMLWRSFTNILRVIKSKFFAVSGAVKLKRVLIFGAGEAGVYFKSKLDNYSESNMKPVVFIDDDTAIYHKRIRGMRVYGGRDKLAEAIEKYNIDEVIVAIPTAGRELLKYIVNVCRDTKCTVRRFGTIDDNDDLAKVKVSNINFEDLLRRDSIHLNMETVSNFIKDKVVLVTGGAGSIGSEICRQVLRFGCQKLVIFDINENGLFFIDNELKEGASEIRHEVVLGSIRDRSRISEVMDKYNPSIVFHAAAHKHVPMMEINPKEAIKNNVVGTINVAQCAIEHNVDKVILISTDKAVNPTNIMGASKRIAEQVIQMFDGLSDTNFAAVRFGNVLGSNGSVVPFFQKQISSGGPVTVTHPEMRRYFMTIPEAVQLVLEAGAMAFGGEIFVLDMGEPVNIYDLACDLIKLSGYEPNVDIPIIFTGLRPGEKLFEEISLAEEDVDTTSNAKILIMKPIPYDVHELALDIKELEESVKINVNSMFKAVKKIVPTFSHKEVCEE